MNNPFREPKIHCWGGLGSQLFAASVAFDLKSRFPNKSPILVLHSGGVTERIPELPEIFPEFRYEFIRDFNSLASPNIPRFKLRRLIRKLMYEVLRHLGLLQSADDAKSFNSIKNWTFEIRGHYSYREVSDNFLRAMYKNLQYLYADDYVYLRNSISVHYRLGDLLTLAVKNPIDSERVVDQIAKVTANESVSCLYLFSDSPEIATQLLEKENVSTKIIVLSLPTSQVIFNCLNSRHFIGTSSKVSFWVALLRSSILNEASFLPNEKLLEIEWLSREKNSIQYY